MYVPNSKWTWAFTSVTFIQAAVVLGLEGYVSPSHALPFSLLAAARNRAPRETRVFPRKSPQTQPLVVANHCSSISAVFGLFQIGLKLKPNEERSASRTIPTYLSLLIFGLVYQLVLVYDALRLKNTIQIIGLCLYNVGILVYTSNQTDQIHDAVINLQGSLDAGFWNRVKPFLIAVPCVVALGTVLMSGIAYKLYEEFAWTIYKHISADVKLKRRYLVYQVSRNTFAVAIDLHRVSTLT